MAGESRTGQFIKMAEKTDKSKINIRLEKWELKNLYEILQDKRQVITEKDNTEAEAIKSILPKIVGALNKSCNNCKYKHFDKKENKEACIKREELNTEKCNKWDYKI